MNKIFKNILLVSMLFIFSNLHINHSSRNALPLLSLANISHADYEVPDKCRDQRREAYKSCVASLTLSAMCSVCVVVPLAPLCALVPEIPLGCIAAGAVCSTYINRFQRCCKGLVDVPSEGWSKKMLRSAASCSSCSLRENILKAYCNQ